VENTFSSPEHKARLAPDSGAHLPMVAALAQIVKRRHDGKRFFRVSRIRPAFLIPLFHKSGLTAVQRPH
jgi:hypothetical protein